MAKKKPKIIEEVGFEFSWDERKVWKLNVPVEKMHMKELNGILRYHFGYF